MFQGYNRKRSKLKLCQCVRNYYNKQLGRLPFSLSREGVSAEGRSCKSEEK